MKSPVLSGSLLVAGTAIGGGMLALPVLTSQGGFVPSLFIYVLCWLFMAATGFLLLELTLAYGKGSNLITIATKTLGIPGQVVTWTLYLYMFYCLTVAYMVGSGNIFNSFIGSDSPAYGILLFTAIFAPIVWVGAKLVSPINGYLMFALIALYAAFIVMGAPYVNVDLLQRRDWQMSLIALPIAFTSFAYQGIIPTLVSYLNEDRKKIRLCLILGTLIPLIVYVIWQALILGIIPVEGENGLKAALDNGDNAISPLKNFISNPYLVWIGSAFAFLALLTSFFGVTLGLKDFLADGLNIQKTKLGRLHLCLYVFLPPLLISLIYPNVFLLALDWAGGYGCALLLGLLPILMTYQKRYVLKDETKEELGGGKPLLAVLLIFVIFEIMVEWFTDF